MTKDENGSYRPSDKITRAEMAKVVVVMRGHDNYQSNDTFFYDVAKEHWAYNYVAAAKQLLIIDGKGDGLFLSENCIVANVESAFATCLARLFLICWYLLDL